MGIVLSLFIIAAGGALTRSGGSATVNGMSPDSAGLVLIGTGIVWFVLSLMLWNVFREREATRPRAIPLRGARPAAPPRTAHLSHHR